MYHLSWDVISQFGIAVFGILGIFLVARKNRWGFVIGLCAQPFWFVTSVIHEQWGIFGLACVYTANWLYGIYNWFLKKPKTPV